MNKIDEKEFEMLFGEYDEELFGKLRPRHEYEKEQAEQKAQNP